jgi:hypothetical protein
VAEEDLQRVAQATGAAVQTTVNELDPRVLGTCRHFEEVQVRRATLSLCCIKCRAGAHAGEHGSCVSHSTVQTVLIYAISSPICWMLHTEEVSRLLGIRYVAARRFEY